MVEGIVLKDARVKFKLNHGGDQTIIVDVPGATLEKQIQNLEKYAQDAKDNIESLQSLKVEGIQIEFGQDSVWDLGSIFR